MKIAIMGGGAIGSVVAAYLKKANVDVTLIGKLEHVRVINQNGLKVTGVRGEEVIHLPAKIVIDEKYDLVVFTTKTQDLEKAYQENQEYLDGSLILTSQNGVQADNILSCHFEKEDMFSSIVMFGATYTKPGEVVFNFEGDWILGMPYAHIGPKAREIESLLKQAFKAVLTADSIGQRNTRALSINRI